MKIYISGRIVGDPDYRKKFDRAEKMLRERGHIVLNPAVLPTGLTNQEYMRIDLAMIDAADAVLVLPDVWNAKSGMALEIAYCAYIEKKWSSNLEFLEAET